MTRPATADDIDAAAAVLGDAFVDYAWTRWTVDPDDHLARITALQTLTLRHFGLGAGEIWVTEVDGVIRSVAAWTDSGRVGDVRPDAALGETVARLEGSRHAASLAAEAQVAGWRPTERHLFLGVVGTVSVARGRGLGRRTLGPLLAASDTDGVAAVLETSAESNLVFYETLGFAVVDHCRIDGGGPPVWLMSRPSGGGSPVGARR